MVKLSKETHLEMFTKMERIREFDSRINKLVRRGFVQGMTHFSVGEEAANVGAVQHLSYDDIFFSNHRGHGQSIAQDMDLNKMMAELAGKATGVSKGRGGSMHLADFEKGNYGTNGIVGGGYALAVGAALTQQYKETGNIVVAFSGDGATNEGSFHESVNMAATWKLPVIFFIINNVSVWSDNRVFVHRSGYQNSLTATGRNREKHVVNLDFCAVEDEIFTFAGFDEKLGADTGFVHHFVSIDPGRINRPACKKITAVCFDADNPLTFPKEILKSRFH